MPKVSVIIPVYNSSEYICGTIESVLAQTFKDYEIIIIDDGSTDNTREILKKYNGGINYFYQENKGVASARNFGIKKAKGEFIAILDSDDIWLPNKLELQIKILEVSKESAFIFSDSEMFEGDCLIRSSMCKSNRQNLRKDSFRKIILSLNFDDGSVIKGEIFQDLLEGNLIPASTVVIRKEVLDDIGDFDPEVCIADDYDLWLRISEKFTIIYLNKVTLRYRYRESSLSGDRILRQTRYNETAGIVLEKFLKTHQSFRSSLTKKIILLYKSASRGYLHCYNFKKARELAFKSLNYDKLQIKLYFYIVFSLLPLKILNFIAHNKQRLRLVRKN